jgi:lipopolysaccharide/colanic/teichoic acid biosynthesis glycosyltransferase
MNNVTGSRFRYWMVRIAAGSGWLSFVEKDLVQGYLAAAEYDHLVARESGIAFQLTIKRAIDICLSATMILVLAPVMVLIVLLVRLDSKGPIIFRSPRIGRHGGKFEMWKFRTMVADPSRIKRAVNALQEAGTVAVFKVDTDPRITRVGRLLRRYSLDELPQFLNVFLGDMSLVGPPARSSYLYERLNPTFYEPSMNYGPLTKDLRPGVTGLWKFEPNGIYFESAATSNAYLKHWTPILDFKILVKTVALLLGLPIRPVAILQKEYSFPSSDMPENVLRSGRNMEVSRRDDEWVQILNSERTA